MLHEIYFFISLPYIVQTDLECKKLSSLFYFLNISTIITQIKMKGTKVLLVKNLRQRFWEEQSSMYQEGV